MSSLASFRADPMIAVIDESTPWLTPDRSSVLYTLAVVILDDGSVHSDHLRSALNRRRPFHWESDTGTNVRGMVVTELCAVVAVP